MNKTFFALLALTMVITACKPQGGAGNEVARPQKVAPKVAVAEPTQAAEPTQVVQDGSYTQYADGVIGNGQESVLFFHATWCPKCKENDGRLKEFYGSSDYPRSVYKIDYDTSTDLKSQYGIIGQDTFILIDGNGNEVKRVRFPSREALRDLLG
ncbi:MAG: thioredoxin family protein [Candidatus Peribacteraceae bacterium]|jgi:thiol-disulfide isomerase/thioredoxin|nr:thioredoxin family protein [Candidatus Peribacteraceae bacterium]|tara:strand:+ start:30580 stop:31041 length:462 start_codon:yes stop_codon:yes gene_type:complete